MEGSIVLVTAEEIKVEVPHQITKISRFIKHTVEDFTGDIKIRIPKSHIDLILEFACHHNFEVVKIDKPISGTSISDSIKDPWDIEFLHRVKKDYDLADFVLSVNFLDISGLLELLFAFIAWHFKGKNLENIRKKHGIIEEFTEEEEAKIMRENPWAPQ